MSNDFLSTRLKARVTIDTKFAISIDSYDCKMNVHTFYESEDEIMIDMYLYDDNEPAQVQFVGFVGEESRYDLMLIQTDRHYGKTIVLNMQNNRYGLIGSDDLEEEGYVAYALGVNEAEGEEIQSYLNEVIQ